MKSALTLFLLMLVPTMASANDIDKPAYLEQTNDVEKNTFVLALDLDQATRLIPTINLDEPQVKIFYHTRTGAYGLERVDQGNRFRFKTTDIAWSEDLNGSLWICDGSKTCVSIGYKLPTYVDGYRFRGLNKIKDGVSWYKAIEPIEAPTLRDHPGTPYTSSGWMLSPPPPPSMVHP